MITVSCSDDCFLFQDFNFSFPLVCLVAFYQKLDILHRIEDTVVNVGFLEINLFPLRPLTCRFVLI